MTDVGVGGFGPSVQQRTQIDQTKGGLGVAPQTKAPEEYKSSHGVLSGKELMEQMGAPPKTDVKIFGITVKTNSVAYKGALEHLQAYQQRLDSIGDQRLENVKMSFVTSLKQQLQEIVDNADAYNAKHDNVEDKKGRRDVMTALKQMAQDEMGRLDQLTHITGIRGKDINVSEALALLRGGVTDATPFTRDLNDSMIDRSKSKDNFGAGKVSSVALVDYGSEVRVIKYLHKRAENMMTGEILAGFDKNDMRVGARNVATAAIAQFLGLGHMVPMPQYVIHNGQLALAMKPAPGEAVPCMRDDVVTSPVEIARFDKNLKQYEEYMAAGLTDKAKAYHRDELERLGAYKDDQGNWHRKTLAYKDIPYLSTTNPAVTASVQKGLLDLQSLHCLVGQLDGQPENIFFQVKNGKALVTGIDQDMCLGSQFKCLNGMDVDGDLSLLEETAGGPPPLMSRDFYNRLMAMTDNDMRLLCGPQITQEEKDNGVNRLALFKAHAKMLEDNGRIVDDFETWPGRDPKTGQTVNVTEFLKNSDQRSYVTRDGALIGKLGAPVPLDPKKHA